MINRKIFDGQEVQEKDFGRFEFDYMESNGDVVLKLKTPETRIAELKAYLQATDYKAIKFAEGEMSAEEYAETKSKRQAWRAEINAIENKIKNL